MKFNFYKKNTDFEIPPYFLAYKEQIENTEKLPIPETRFVVFDTETTGFSLKNDKILSIGAISLKNNVINVKDAFEVYIKQEIFKAETVKIHGILKEGDLDKITELEAIKQFLKYIGNAVLVGHHIHFDIEMFNKMLQCNNLPKLLNKTVDTGFLYKKSKHKVYQNDQTNYSLDNLCDELNISKSDRHTASGDAYITAIAFLKILSRMNKNNDLRFKDILINY